MATIEELIEMENAKLIATWRRAKVAEIRAYGIKLRAKGTEDYIEAVEKAAEAKLDAETIRLVISFRLTGRDAPIEPPKDD